MSSYKPFLIADFKAGLELGREPWLLPGDAFFKIEDAFLHHGVLHKRKGYSSFASISGGGAITGIFNLVNADASKALLVTDADKLYKYNSGTQNLDQVTHATLGSGDVWTGGAEDFVHWANWKKTQSGGDVAVYMANGKDRIQYYDGTTFDHFLVDFDGDASNDVNSCCFVMVHKERLILLSTEEGGGLFPQRARWCAAGNPGDWTNDGYVDAPTSQWIRGAAYLRDDIVVWFDDSVWLLRYTGSSDLVFRWEKVSTAHGCCAPFSVVSFMDKSQALGKAGLVRTDGLSVARMDEKIPDLALSFDQNSTETCYSAVLADMKQVWLLYPHTGSNSPDRVLAFNYEDNAWSIFNLSFNCLGFFVRTETLTWSDLSGTPWSTLSEPWLSNPAQAGYPIVLGGDNSGNVYKLNDTGTDGVSNEIGFNVESGRWNPFQKMGFKARLGFIDFLVETNSNHELFVDFYLDANPIAYQTKTLCFDQEGEKAWVRLFSGAIGAFHRIRLYHTAINQTVKIHAIMPWFAPAGRLV